MTHCQIEGRKIRSVFVCHIQYLKFILCICVSKHSWEIFFVFTYSNIGEKYEVMSIRLSNILFKLLTSQLFNNNNKPWHTQFYVINFAFFYLDFYFFFTYLFSLSPLYHFFSSATLAKQFFLLIFFVVSLSLFNSFNNCKGFCFCSCQKSYLCSVHI